MKVYKRTDSIEVNKRKTTEEKLDYLDSVNIMWDYWENFNSIRVPMKSIIFKKVSLRSILIVPPEDRKAVKLRSDRKKKSKFSLK